MECDTCSNYELDDLYTCYICGKTVCEVCGTVAPADGEWANVYFCGEHKPVAEEKENQ